MNELKPAVIGMTGILEREKSDGEKSPSDLKILQRGSYPTTDQIPVSSWRIKRFR